MKPTCQQRSLYVGVRNEEDNGIGAERAADMMPRRQ